ncbi:YeeE/YedE family protein [Modestobacter altitudinis]|uniref:YeeE/YedE family protein n=1 Tax=Modestobacter altitudinis TaxID=2213158 RepID=UPI001FE89D18|nr:YeeE/YedE family protein [Modestobacter altitudinis]
MATISLPRPLLPRTGRAFPTAGAAPEPVAAGPVRWVPLGVATALAAALTTWTWSRYGTQQGVFTLLGLGLGAALFHSRFGFTSAWRQLVAVGNGAGLRAHALLLGTTATLFALLLGTGTGLFGTTPTPTSTGLGVALVAGAVLFGIGMQLGGACASGTLYVVGSGQTSILLTLGGFITGTVLYAWAYPLVDDLPAFPAFTLADHVGWAGSWLVTLALLGVVVGTTSVVQPRRVPPPAEEPETARGIARVVRGSWPKWVGALVLAVLGAAVLLTSGSAWGITSAFTLWGSKVLQAVGLHPETWGYWQQPALAAQLSGPVLADRTSLTDLGIVLGAALASAAGGAWALHRRIPLNTASAAVVGGLLMGIGARLASGCNIGAYLAGIASGSASGWVWGLAALGGTWIGLRARRLFGLSVPAPRDSSC